MTPLEQMTKAAYEEWIGPVRSTEPAWDGLDDSFRQRLIDTQIAALLALKNSQNLPVLVEVQDEHGTILAFAPDDHADLRAIIRAIAKGESNDSA